jgi:hypothetical protein
MTVMNKLAHALDRRDEVPNQELAKELAETGNEAGIREIIDGLKSKDRKVNNDCIKVAYEIGYIDPELISAYADEFLDLLRSRNNRLVWGGMTALTTIAEIKADDLYKERDKIIKAIDKGSVITQDSGIRVLARVASQKNEYRAELFPYLLEHLETCRPKDVSQRSEQIVMAVDADNKGQFIAVIEKRMAYLKPSQLKRLEKVIREAEKY